MPDRHQRPPPSALARAGMIIADGCERHFPDAFVFALGAVLVVFAAGLASGETPGRLITEFGNGFWVLIPFTMQMALVIIGGFVVASSPPVARVIVRLAAVPKTPRGAVAFVALLAMATSLLSWGLSLIFTGLLVREVTRRIPRLDYRAVAAASYLGLGSVWALGLSSSAALLQASPASIPESLLRITGVIPLVQTIFLWQSMLMAVVLIVLSVAIAYYSCPHPDRARSAAEMGIRFEPLVSEQDHDATTSGHRLDRSPILPLCVALLMAAYLTMQVSERGFFAAVDLGTFNMAFLAAGMVLHWRPRSFLQAVARSVPATTGVLIQFPFYAGIFGLIAHTGLASSLEQLFLRATTKETFPLVVAAYSAILGLFVPSGGGKWVIEAPYVMSVANDWQAHLGWTVQIYNAAETLPNLINPFWMLPLMGLLSVRARDLVGYSILQLIFHVPVVFFLCWLLGRTLPYIPPQIP
jgi:short-chain fatty acids transporter